MIKWKPKWSPQNTCLNKTTVTWLKAWMAPIFRPSLYQLPLPPNFAIPSINEKYIPHLLTLNLVRWLGLANWNDYVPVPALPQGACVIPLTLFHLALPWEHAGASLPKDERHVEQNQVTSVAPDKTSLDQPMVSKWLNRGVSPAKNSRSSWLTPSWPQKGEQCALIVACHWGFTVACRASHSITEAIDNW